MGFHSSRGGGYSTREMKHCPLTQKLLKEKQWGRNNVNINFCLILMKNRDPNIFFFNFLSNTEVETTGYTFSQKNWKRQTPRKLLGFHRTEDRFWPEFADIKHDYTQELYWSYSSFISQCPRTGKFRSVWKGDRNCRACDTYHPKYRAQQEQVEPTCLQNLWSLCALDKTY